jgi:dehydrogenase/reductase SDR family protein 7B
VRVVLSARSESTLNEIRQQLLSSGVREVLVLPLDLCALASPAGGSELAQRAAATVEKTFGRCDILVHNGGMSQRGDVLSTVPSVERTLMDTNFGGAVSLTHAVLPGMIQRKQGWILAMSSVQGLLPLNFRSSYAASKHALNAYFHSLRYEVS